MCDCPPPAGKSVFGRGWKSWGMIPEPCVNPSASSWSEASHALGPNTPAIKAFGQVRLRYLNQLADSPINVTQLSMVCHIGTHLDSPRHFFDDGPSFESIPLSRLWGPGWVHPVSPAKGLNIEPEDFGAIDKKILPGDILVINTGLHEICNSLAYQNEHPSLSERCANWIIEKGIKMICIDFPTPEIPVSKRQMTFNFPIHRMLLSSGVLIAEHLTGLTPFNHCRVEIMVNALNIEGGDGSPARVLIRKINDDRQA